MVTSPSSPKRTPRRSGRAFRKNVLPTKPASPPAAPSNAVSRQSQHTRVPASQIIHRPINVPEENRRGSRRQRIPASVQNKPTYNATSSLNTTPDKNKVTSSDVKEGKKVTAPATDNKRVGVGKRKIRSRQTVWEQRFPSKRRRDVRPLDYNKTGLVLALPSSNMSDIRVQNRFFSRLIEDTRNGRSVASLIGADGVSVMERAYEHMTIEEINMYKHWDGGRRKPPAQDWGDGGAILGGAWETLAQCLNEIYGVSGIHGGKAKEWWDKHDGWHGLARAVLKARKWRAIIETDQVARVREQMYKHFQLLEESFTWYKQLYDEASVTLKARDDSVSVEIREINTAQAGLMTDDEDEENPEENTGNHTHDNVAEQKSLADDLGNDAQLVEDRLDSSIENGEADYLVDEEVLAGEDAVEA